MIQRELYMKQIRAFIDKDIVKVMTGIRRCGKSVMMQLIQQELIGRGVRKNDMLSLNFESKTLQFKKESDPAFAYIQKFIHRDDRKKYLFFDEIQDLPGWEELVNSLLVDFDVDIYVTGSNAKLLSGELATYLGGRYVEIKIYPFSFREIIDICHAQGDTRGISELFLHYLTYGGMPFLYQNQIDETASLQYLEDVFDSIILKDITQRNHVRDVGLFKKVLLYFIANIGNTYSSQNIRNYLKSENRSVSLETVYNYLEYSKEACVLQLASRVDIIGKRVLQFQEKIYLVDHGFREAIYGNNLRDIQQILENLIYMELLRRGYHIYIGKNDVLEVDFVAEKGNLRIYIQAAYLLADQATVDREFRVLESIPDNYPKYVVTMDEIDRSRNGIKHKNVRDFLLMESYE